MKEEQILLFALRTATFAVKNNYKYLYKDDLSCRACLQTGSIESVEHFCCSCDAFESERNTVTLQVGDIFSSYNTQLKFVKWFKPIARKWKVLLDMRGQTISMDPPAPASSDPECG